MPKTDLYKMDGSKAGEIELSEKIFAAKVNGAVLHTVVVNHLANKRQGTQSAKTGQHACGSVDSRRRCFCSEAQRLQL